MFDHKIVQLWRQVWCFLQRRGGQLGLLLLGLWLALLVGTLQHAAQQPVDAVLVLGGSIRREIYAAQQRPPSHIPILISQGSPDPCIWQIFAREAVSMEQVWLEKCAQSTFDNFRFSLPILLDWGSHHVRLVTSGKHLRRAQWMGRLILGAHGVWVEVDAAGEWGRPGNRESGLKTTLDLLRSLAWALISQVYQPHCRQVVPLTAVDMTLWQRQGYHCEHQAGFEAVP